MKLLNEMRPRWKKMALLVVGTAALSACSEQPQNKATDERTGAAAEPGVAYERPVVVELYQSQGCSSCPPANANLNKIAGDKDILALSFAVTYWDKLGWKDIFAKPEFTERQWEYARAAGRKQVATPQVVINGSQQTVNGGDMDVLKKAIADNGAPKGGPNIAFESGAEGSGAVVVEAGDAPASPATVWLVRYDPRAQEVAISAGENNGRTLPHKNIVRELVALGPWKGPKVRYEISAPSEEGLMSAALLQQGTGGPITSSAKLETGSTAQQ